MDTENFLEWFWRIGQQMIEFENTTVKSITFRDKGDSVLLVITGDQGDRAVVTFIDGDSMIDCVDCLHRLFRVQMVRWSDDKFR